MADWYLEEVLGTSQPKAQPVQDWWLDEQMGPTLVQEGGAGARRQPGPVTVPIPGSPQPRRDAPARRPAPAVEPRQDGVPAAPELPSGPVPMPPAVEGQPDDAKYAEPDAPTWLGRRWQDIRGKRDERYKDLPSLSELMAANPVSEAQFKLTGSGDAGYGDFFKDQLGDAFIRRFKDANGYEIIGFRGQDGKEQLAYVNKPSWEVNDIDRGISGALPYIPAAGVMGRLTGALPAIWGVAGQMAGAAATSGAQDAVASAQGSEQGVDLGKMAGATIGAGIGSAIAPAAGWAMAKVAEKGLIDKSGTLTAKGVQAAQQVGADVQNWTSDIAKRFAQEYAKTGDAKAAAIMAELGDVGIPTTLGQRTKDVRQLMNEQSIRDGNWGEAAAAKLKEFDERQWQAMVNATMGQIDANTPGMSLRLAPHRSPGEYNASQIGHDIDARLTGAKEAFKKKVDDAWDKTGTLRPTPESLGELGSYVNNQLRTMQVTEKSHPVTADMVRLIEDFIGGKAPAQVSKLLKNDPSGDVNAMRQILSEAYRDLPKGPDRTRAAAVYDAFNTWTRDMAEQKLLMAEGMDAATAAANLVTARHLSADFHNLFDRAGSAAFPQGNSNGARIMKQILEKADSPSQIIRELFVGPTSQSIRPGSIAALNAIKQASQHLPKEEAAALMGDLKLAYWLRIVRNPNASDEAGKIYNPQRLLGNLRTSLDSHRDVWMTLFSKEDRAFAQRIVRSLENGPTFHDWTIKPNSSRSATTAVNLLQDFMGFLLRKTVGPEMGKVVSAAAGKVTGMGRATAGAAINQSGRYAQPMLAPGLGAAVGSETQ